MIINGINVSKSDKTQNFEVIKIFFLKGSFFIIKCTPFIFKIGEDPNIDD
jgi:hypothetical protein